MIFSLLAIFVLTACKEVKKPAVKDNSITTEIAYESFGAKISSEKAVDAAALLATFNSLKIGDTVSVKFASTIKEVCSKKGCWMKLPLDNETETMVRFKDYGFFMPLDANGKEVIVNGIAYLKETSVDELQHYAKDAGKSAEEIAKITTPKRVLSFEADGVLLAKK